MLVPPIFVNDLFFYDHFFLSQNLRTFVPFNILYRESLVSILTIKLRNDVKDYQLLMVGSLQ